MVIIIIRGEFLSQRSTVQCPGPSNCGESAPELGLLFSSLDQSGGPANSWLEDVGNMCIYMLSCNSPVENLWLIRLVSKF